MRRPPHARGFTLLEMMVALSVISIAIIGLLQVVLGNLNAVGDARDRTEAVTLAQAKLTELERDPIMLLSAESQGNFGEEHARFSWSIAVVETQWPELRQVGVTVSWVRGRKQKQLMIESLVRLPEESATDATATTPAGPAPAGGSPNAALTPPGGTR